MLEGEVMVGRWGGPSRSGDQVSRYPILFLFLVKDMDMEPCNSVSDTRTDLLQYSVGAHVQSPGILRAS